MRDAAATPTNTDNTLKGWQLGAAGNWTVGSNDLFVLGLTFAQNKVDQEQPIFGVVNPLTGTILAPTVGTITESFTPQVFAALETHVNNWLTLRFGGNKGAWYTVEVQDKTPGGPSPTPGFTIHNSPFNMSLGAGAKIGTLQLDAIVNNTFPHNGLYFLSGNQTSPVFTKVTATYPF